MDIPKLVWNSVEATDLIKNGKPVVLLDCPLSIPVANRWTNEFLASVISPEYLCDIYVSDSKRFQYWDSKRNTAYNFTAPTMKESMTFTEFNQCVMGNSKIIESSNETKSKSLKNYYLQQAVVVEMGPKMMEEYMRFSLEAALKFKVEGGWDSFSTNLLLVGSAGYITPCHYDEQQNLFAQINGIKRVRLFPPSAWKRLYTYPYNHPCDRQTRVILPVIPGSSLLDNEIDRFNFPFFQSDCNENTSEYFIDLQPGEVLYIPQYWFHQMEGLTDNISLSWWFKDQTKHSNKTQIDLSSVSMIALRRNIENLISSTVGNQKKAHEFFLAMAANRIPITRPIDIEVSSIFIKSTILNSNQENHNEQFYFPHASDVEAAKDIFIEESWSDLLAQAIKIAGMVVGNQAQNFLQELVAGRFNNLPLV